MAWRIVLMIDDFFLVYVRSFFPFEDNRCKLYRAHLKKLTPAECPVFGRFERLPLAERHSADCRFVLKEIFEFVLFIFGRIDVFSFDRCFNPAG